MSASLSNFEKQQLAASANRLIVAAHAFMPDESDFGWFDPCGPDGWFAFVEMLREWNEKDSLGRLAGK